MPEMNGFAAYLVLPPLHCLTLALLLLALGFPASGVAREVRHRPSVSTHHAKLHSRSARHIASLRHAKRHVLPTAHHHAPLHRRVTLHHPRRRRQSLARPRLLVQCGYSAHARRLLHSQSAYVLDVKTNTGLLARNARRVRPIASISKLMTALVARRGQRPLGGMLRVTARDRDTIKFTGSRLKVGSRLSRQDMYHIALMSSENRAAAALSRDYPGGRHNFIIAMNGEARRLSMNHTHFDSPTGLSPHNVSTAKDLARLVAAADRDALIRHFSTDKWDIVYPGHGELVYVNSNPLVRYGHAPIQLQKTGFINEAGHCMVMRILIRGRPETIVLLGSPTPRGDVADAIRIRHWLECSLT